MTLGTLSWVYKPSDYPRVIGSRLSLLVILVCKTYGQYPWDWLTVLPEETSAYWTGWVIVVFFTANGTSCHKVKTFHCDCQSAHHTSAWIMQSYTVPPYIRLQDRLNGA